MCAKRMTTRDIKDHIKDIYGFDASPSLVDKYGRPLQRLYTLVYFMLNKIIKLLKKQFMLLLE